MRDKEVNKFLRAAAQRLAAARILFDAERYLDCMYIAGYVPECALKAFILANLVPREREEFIAEHFRGRIGHDYEHLKHFLKVRCNRTIPADIAVMFRKMNSWTTDLRYETVLKDRREAGEFLVAAEDVLDWVKRSL